MLDGRIKGNWTSEKDWDSNKGDGGCMRKKNTKQNDWQTLFKNKEETLLNKL